jgi:valyl-tRNA synthetase
MANIRPWCISRQLWWGHRLPVYYCQECAETYVALTAPARCGACDGPVRQDEDVLDTWFSSALWPFATLGWPRQTPELSAFYPTDALVTARDILFLWVARMIMMGLRFTGREPFSDVYVHSVIQAPDGRRMSKSLGTGIDPLDEIDAHGADAVRFGLLAMSSTQDVRYSVEKVRQGQALANKLFNAARFVLTHPRLERAGGPPPPPPTPGFRPEGEQRDSALALEDRWILSRSARIAADTAARLEAFEFSKAALGLYDFVYGELCDWYLELAKARLEEGVPAAQRAVVSAVLLHVLRRTLASAHPVIPFVTEELWSPAGGEGLLAGGRFPDPEPERIDEQAEADMQRAFAAVTALRGWRDSVDARPGTVIPARLNAPGYEQVLDAIARMARFDLSRSDGTGEPVAAVPVPGGTVDVFAVEGLDLTAAQRRLQSRYEALGGDVDRAEGKLANRGFVDKAPPEVVSAERDKLAALREERERLRRELESL